MASAPTYTPIATQTLASNASSVSFTSIPQTYTDLVLVGQARCTRATTQSTLTGYFNSDSATTNYSYTGLDGNGSTASSNRLSGGSYQGIFAGLLAAANNTAGVFSQVLLHIMNYSNTTTYKTCIGRNGAAEIGTEAEVMLWRSTAAITSITINEILGNNLVAGSTFTLYGILAA